MRPTPQLAVLLPLCLACGQVDPETSPDAAGDDDVATDSASDDSTGDPDPDPDPAEGDAGEDDTSTDDGGPAADDNGEDDDADGGQDTSADPPDAEPLAVLNVQSAASAVNGDNLTIVQYTAPADGILVVRGGAAGPTVRSVTFGGDDLAVVASTEEPDYWFAISADMYWMPVEAGQAGDIVWQYDPGEWTTRRRGMIAATIRGANEVHAVSTGSDGLGTNEGRTGPVSAALDVTTETPAVILTAFTSNGPGPSNLTGSDHVLDAFPTIPIEEFHSTRVYGGHLVVPAGTYAAGYDVDETNGWFDYILFVAAFSRHP